MTTAPRRSTGPASRTCAAHRCTTTSTTAATAGTSTSTTCRELPRWLRPFARFDARDHFDRRCRRHAAPPRRRVPGRERHHLPRRPHHRAAAGQGARLRVQPAEPVLVPRRRRRAAARHRRGPQHLRRRHAYLLPPDEDTPQPCAKRMYVSPFNEVDGYYLVRAPRPDATLDVSISLHRDNQPPFVATMRGRRVRAGDGSAGPAADHRPGGTPDGCLAHPRPGHHTLASPGAGGAAMTSSPPTAKAFHRNRSAALAGCGTGSPRSGECDVDPGCGQSAAPRRRAPAGAAGVSGRFGDRRRRPDTADTGAHRARAIGAADRALRADRFRRVLHGGRMDVGRPRRRADRVRRRRWPTWCPDRCNACGPIALARQPESQRNSRDQARRNIAEHYDLSNDTVRRVPRRDA